MSCPPSVPPPRIADLERLLERGGEVEIRPDGSVHEKPPEQSEAARLGQAARALGPEHY